MSRFAYVNGCYVPHGEAAVHIEDRGYQFADGVYEVIAVHQGTLVDEEGHMERLDRSLGELDIAWPMSRRALATVMGEVVRRNRIRDGIVYLQITRGVAPRNHAFPTDIEAAVVMTARHTRPFDVDNNSRGIDVVTIDDIRWKRCDIKTISLLPNILGKEIAARAGAYEAWMVGADGRVTEGTSTNAWIVTSDGELLTRQTDNAILSGITRAAVIEAAAEAGIQLVERPFTVEEAKSAREAFLTSTTSFVKPVVKIDGQAIGNGHIGTLTARLLDLYRAHMDGQRDAADAGKSAA
jgi:D-alanine transaminase